jgi:hypothetical protein
MTVETVPASLIFKGGVWGFNILFGFLMGVFHSEIVLSYPILADFLIFSNPSWIR